MPRRHEPAGGGAGTGSGTAAGTGALRGLVGAGPSQVGIVGALRARDVSRPTPEDVARALTKPEPTARPTIRQDVAQEAALREVAPEDAAPQEAASQEAAESGNGGGTSVSS
jgi:hypothetical protein